jgi:fatty acid amide hydrolase 2
MPSLLTLSATKLAHLIRTREVTSREVVEAHILRIQRANPILNAVVVDRFAQARREADRADAKVKAGEELPPLHGVPCTIKECFALVGMPQTAGLVARVGRLATEDATTVARLRAAGAIPLGVTNTSELCMWMESNNRVYGRTNNPYDPTRMVGGSSGGEGAIVGVGGSPFGLGSDIGGSIRMPAFFNGVFGHKPTGGLVPGSGQFPIAENDGLKLLSTGPLARRAEDLHPLLEILAGPDGIDSRCEAREIGDPKAVNLAELEVIDVEDNGVTAVAAELRDAQRRVATQLSAMGARVQKGRFEALRHSFEIWSARMSAAGGKTFRQLLGDGRDLSPLWELMRWTVRRSPHTLPAIVLALIEPLPKLLPSRADRALALAAELKREMVERIGPRGVLLYPSYVETAPRHNPPMWPPVKWV